MILTQKKCDKVKSFNMLNNLCENKTWLKMISLYSNLFLWSKLQIYLFEHPWDKARYIVPWNELKDTTNHHMVEYNSNKKCCSCCTIVVKDTYKTNRIHGDIPFNIKQYVSNSHTNSLYGPLLKLFEGINATTGIVHEIVVNDYIETNNSTFIDPSFHVSIDFNTFISNHHNLKDINLDGFPKPSFP